MRAVAPGFAERTSPAAMRWGIYVFIFVTFLVYIVPMLLFRNAKAYRHYANLPETWFVLGLVIMAVAVRQMLA